MDSAYSLPRSQAGPDFAILATAQEVFVPINRAASIALIR
jgi:hypothetical protein